MKRRKLLKLHFRSSELPDVKLPISVRSVGHYIAEKDWSESPVRSSNFIQLYWGVSGTGAFVIDGMEYLLPPDHVCFYRRNDRHTIKAISEEWNYHWFSFDGEAADLLLDGFAYSKYPFYAGSCPEELFVKMSENIYDSTPLGLRLIGAVAYEVLARAGGSPQYHDRYDQLVKRCIKLIKEIYDEPETEINLLAEELNVHRSTLNRAFNEKMKMSPLKYLTGFRVQRALAMLRETNLPVAEVGRRNGYPDPCYFSKIIKKAVGVSPDNFR